MTPCETSCIKWSSTPTRWRVGNRAPAVGRPGPLFQRPRGSAAAASPLRRLTARLQAPLRSSEGEEEGGSPLCRLLRQEAPRSSGSPVVRRPPQLPFKSTPRSRPYSPHPPQHQRPPGRQRAPACSSLAALVAEGRHGLGLQSVRCGIREDKIAAGDRATP
jgi:hypothetical protein